MGCRRLGVDGREKPAVAGVSGSSAPAAYEVLLRRNASITISNAVAPKTQAMLR